MNKPNRKADLRDDTPAKPNAGAGTQKDVKDSSDPCDTRRLDNPVPVEQVKDAKESPASKITACRIQQGGNNYRGNTN